MTIQCVVDFAELEQPLVFSEPLQYLSASTPGELFSLLASVEAASQLGLWGVVCLPYEAGAAFALPVHPSSCVPFLAWAALFTHPVALTWPPVAELSPLALTMETSPALHARALAAIREYLLAGESYQVNLTGFARLAPCPPLDELFFHLQSCHRFPYAAWLHLSDGGDGQPLRIASFSPELFLSRTGTTLTTGPIKGTRPRGETLEEDGRLAEALVNAPKDRAEHVMIVDMARNDLGRVCRTGSIRVASLAARRSFSTVHHLESRVSGELHAGVGLGEILVALFPAASITGAPKHRTMEIIRELEGGPRGIYTGAIGVIQPGGDFTFNVAIRTVTQRGEEAPRIGLGGGIVADSQPEEEWLELAHKGSFLQHAPPPLGLIESMRVERDGSIPWLMRHLARLADSAHGLGIGVDLAVVEARVEEQATIWHQAGRTPHLLRLLVKPHGVMEISGREICSPPMTGLRVRLARWRVDGQDPLLRHKTTRREPFDAALHEARAAGYDDALFLNTQGRVTEGAMRGILVREGGRWLAPPLSDGCLDSLWRREEMARLGAVEESLSLDRLSRAEIIRMGNAVQGGVDVAVVEEESGQRLWGGPPSERV